MDGGERSLQTTGHWGTALEGILRSPGLQSASSREEGAALEIRGRGWLCGGWGTGDVWCPWGQQEERPHAEDFSLGGACGLEGTRPACHDLRTVGVSRRSVGTAPRAAVPSAPAWGSAQAARGLQR